MRRAILAVAILPLVTFCQTPVITSLVNSASYEPTLGVSGSIVTIFGTNLATATATAQTLPLPLSLAGTSVTVGGVAAPLFYVSPTQINLQTPGVGDIVVAIPAAVSTPYQPANTDQLAGGIFTTDATGCGQGAVLNVGSDGTLSANSPANSAAPGDWIAIYGSGLAVSDTLNSVGTYPPISSTTSGASAGEFNFSPDSTLGGAVPWTGLAPGYVGLDQVNLQIPNDVREGCAVPLQLLYLGGSSRGITQPVTIAVSNKRGPCVDPPTTGYGQIIWQKTISTTGSGRVSSAETITASLQASPGQQLPSTTGACGLPLNGCSPTVQSGTYFGPACPVKGYRSLDAGTVTIAGADLPATPARLSPFQFGQLVGLSAYEATLPPGTIREGVYTVNATGGADVGAFNSSVAIGSDIEIQTTLQGAYAPCGDLTVNWSGGDKNSIVTVALVQGSPALGSEWSNFYDVEPASAGVAHVVGPLGCTSPGPAPGSPMQIVVEVDPGLTAISPFSASGLSLGGQATWRYVHAFEGTIAFGN